MGSDRCFICLHIHQLTTARGGPNCTRLRKLAKFWWHRVQTTVVVPHVEASTNRPKGSSPRSLSVIWQVVAVQGRPDCSACICNTYCTRYPVHHHLMPRSVDPHPGAHTHSNKSCSVGPVRPYGCMQIVQRQSLQKLARSCRCDWLGTARLGSW